MSDNVTDIVERLQALTTTRNGRGLDPGQYHLTNPDGPEAAELIATLRKQLDDAREALQYCADAPFSGWTIAQAVARKALKGQP